MMILTIMRTYARIVHIYILFVYNECFPNIQTKDTMTSRLHSSSLIYNQSLSIIFYTEHVITHCRNVLYNTIYT